ncbi:MAG: hypothetical protein NE328_12860 [Lentisphaeraceae bacterium]|nr:hypothetical protein [Lentisphaeraceae bacterium]
MKKQYLLLVFSVSFLFFSTSVLSQNISVKDFPLKWRGDVKGSTHELAMKGNYIYVTGQNMDQVAKVGYDGSMQHFQLPKNSGPHGILFDKAGRLWVSLEFLGLVVRLDESGKIVEQIDCRIHSTGSAPINTAPHGIALDADGVSIWFTGKRTSTVGKIKPNRTVEHFELPSLGALPIFLHAGPDGNMWGTELVGNKILKVTSAGKVSEYSIPTANSRPIAIKPGPNGKYMWFTEEAGNKIGRIDMEGNITEFPVKQTQKNEILAGLTFDSQGNLWTQSYVDQKNPTPAGLDYIIKIDKAILQSDKLNPAKITTSYFPVPTAKTVMHRIKAGKDGNIYFTELMQDKLGVVILK